MATRTFGHICGVDVEMLLHNAEEVVALHIHDLFAPGNRHDFALDLQDGRAVCELDAEGVAGEGKHVFFEDEGLGLRGDELREETDGPRDGGKVGHVVDVMLVMCKCECQVDV